MGNVTLMIPEELKNRMKQHSEIRWSEVIRKIIQKKIEDLELLDKLTPRDALIISKKIDASVSRKLGLVS